MSDFWSVVQLARSVPCSRQYITELIAVKAIVVSRCSHCRSFLIEANYARALVPLIRLKRALTRGCNHETSGSSNSHHFGGNGVEPLHVQRRQTRL